VPVAVAVQDDDAPMDASAERAESGALDAPVIVIPPPCSVPLPDGCYRFSFTPSPGVKGVYRGTLRVDRAEGKPVVSGDLYFYPPVLSPSDEPLHGTPSALPETLKLVPPIRRKYGIPIYPRKLYHSYLKATKVTLKSFAQGGKCFATITFEQYRYTQPGPGQFNGSFPPAPGTKTITIRFALTPPPTTRWPGNYYTGEWREGNVSKGAIALGWVSKHFRRCTIEVDTLVDAVAPQPVPALGGAGSEPYG